MRNPHAPFWVTNSWWGFAVEVSGFFQGGCAGFVERERQFLLPDWFGQHRDDGLQRRLARYCRSLPTGGVVQGPHVVCDTLSAMPGMRLDCGWPASEGQHLRC